MENMTGLLVALMFVTLLTIGFGNILAAMAPRLKDLAHVRAHIWQFLWWIILTLILLHAFWRCTTIFSVEEWTFPEFLFVQLGAILLFFASTTLPSEQLPDKERVFYFCLAGFQLWLLGLGVIFGAPSLGSTLTSLSMLAVLAVLIVLPKRPAYRLTTVAALALAMIGLSV